MFRWNRQPETDERICDVNLTPLIDVSLTLVVILLLATPLAFESAIGVRSAQAAARKARERQDTARIELTIVSEDSLRVNRVLVPRTRLEEAVRPLLERSPARQVVIACGDGITHGTFVDVLDRAKRSGAGAIAVQGR